MIFAESGSAKGKNNKIKTMTYEAAKAKKLVTELIIVIKGSGQDENLQLNNRRHAHLTRTLI